MRLWKTVFVSLSLIVWAAATLHADSPAEMLEKGIYNEDTVGNLEEAIKIYRKVVSAAGETEAVAAKAQYRLGQCLLKQGKKTEATKAFKAILSKYPNQKETIAKAKKHLPDELRLLKAPWKDGERLTLTMRLGGGRLIGLIGLSVDSAKLNDEDVWHMNIRRFVGSGNNEGVSQVWAEKANHRPRKTIFDHTVLGKAEATWTDSKLAVTMNQQGKQKKVDIGLDGTTYSNDQVFYGFRQLPLKVGYEVTLPIRVAFTGGSDMNLEVTVSKKETVKTPAGTFECFRLDTNINQTFWVADTPERYVAQFEAGGVTAKLTSINENKPTQFENEELGFSCTVPKGWFHVEAPSKNKKTAGGVQMVSPSMGSVAVYVKDKSLLNDDDAKSNKSFADAKIEKLESAFKDFKLDSKGIQDTKIGSIDALMFTAQHNAANRDYVFGMSVGLTDDKGIQITMDSSESQAKNTLTQFDAIRKSVQLR